MPIKKCEVCGSEFMARLSKIRTCSTQCRNRLIASEKEEKHKKIKQCEVCQKDFEVGGSNPNKRTCSEECSYILRGSLTSKSVAMKCVTCGKGFLSQLSQLNTPGGGSYCSKQCMYDRNKEEMTRACACCGKMFSSPPSQLHVTTCSTECGYKIRVDPNRPEQVRVTCRTCGKEEHLPPSLAATYKHCSRTCDGLDPESIARKSDLMSGASNPQWKGGLTVTSVSSTGKTYSRPLPHIESEKIARRKRAKSLATPAWANIEAMQSIYKEAQEKTRETGVVYHVDHIVPLTSDLVSGLHNEFNLQVLTATENLKKHNKHWPDKP